MGLMMSEITIEIPEVCQLCQFRCFKGYSIYCSFFKKFVGSAVDPNFVEKCNECLAKTKVIIKYEGDVNEEKSN